MASLHEPRDEHSAENARDQVVGEVEPEVIVHQLTTLSGPMSMRDARHIAAGQIQGVSAIVNPDKLRHLGSHLWSVEQPPPRGVPPGGALLPEPRRAAGTEGV